MHERWTRYWLRSIIIVADSIISPITSGWIILLQFWMNFMHSFFIQGLGHIPCIQCSNGQKRNAICWQPFSEMYSRKKKKTIENHLAHQWGTRMECISRGRCAFFLWQKLQIANCKLYHRQYMKIRWWVYFFFYTFFSVWNVCVWRMFAREFSCAKYLPVPPDIESCLPLGWTNKSHWLFECSKS